MSVIMVLLVLIAVFAWGAAMWEFWRIRAITRELECEMSSRGLYFPRIHWQDRMSDADLQIAIDQAYHRKKSYCIDQTEYDKESVHYDTLLSVQLARATGCKKETVE